MKKTSDKQKKANKKKILKKENKQVIIAISLMIAIIIMIIAVPIIKKNYFDKFVYISLDFQKTQLGDLYFYSTRIPLVNQSGSLDGMYAMNFRSNPKETEYIPIDNKTITFRKYYPVYVTFNPEMQRCDDNLIAIINLRNFLHDFANLDLKSGVTNKEYAKEANISHITCENTYKNTVILIDSGNETKIEKIKKDCYKLTYNNCEIIPVTERFVITILEEYMSYFVRED